MVAMSAAVKRACLVVAMLAAPAAADEPPLGEPAPLPDPGEPPPPPPEPERVIVVPAKPVKKDDEGVVRLSLPTEADREAWRRPGFRLGLGLVYGEFSGLRGAPSGRLIGPNLHVGVRLDPDWSLFASFVYARAHTSGGLNGLRFAGTIDPTWHATRHLALAVGFGFGGIVEGRTGRMDPDPKGDSIETSYTFPDARTPLASCSGVGAAGLARAEWSYVIGPRASTSIALEAVGQWTACVDDSGRVEPDTGTAIVRRQFWAHAGGTLAWEITWR
jgi:hypothetical protein